MYMNKIKPLSEAKPTTKCLSINQISLDFFLKKKEEENACKLRSVVLWAGASGGKMMWVSSSCYGSRKKKVSSRIVWQSRGIGERF